MSFGIIKWNKKMDKLCYIDTNSFTEYINAEGSYSDIAKYVKTTFDSSNYELDRPLPKGKNENVAGLIKYELGGKTMTELAAWRPKTYSYLTDGNDEDKK